MTPVRRDLRMLGETLLVIVVTWFALGVQLFARTIHQADGQLLVDPYTRSALEAGRDWTEHLYRIGVLGGSKMHEFGGSPPLLQVCAALGLSTSTTVNVMSLFVQLAFGFFGLLVIDAMRAERGDRTPLSVPVRIGAIWLCAFAPVLAWRLGVGHENLLYGLLPFVAAFALLWSARAQRTSAVALVFATFAVANGVSGLGAQMVVYGTVFGAPLALAVIADAPRGARWTRAHTGVVAALAAGVLLVLPRIVPMLAHATGPDATRSLGASVTYSYGAPVFGDWIESLPWSPAATRATGAAISWHERNYPIGPLLALLPLLWHRRRNGWLGLAIVLSATLSICFALDVRPISTLLLRAAPPLEAFRVPARSLLPVAVVLPPLLVGALLAWRPGAVDRRIAWAGVGLGLLVLLAHRVVGGWLPDVGGWPLLVVIVVLAIRGRLTATVAAGTVIVLGALGATSFEARFRHDLPLDRIEDGPAAVRAAVQAELPATATVFDRVQVVDAPPPYLMSMAWAAGLPSLDGVWYPPARFARLVSTLTGEPIATTAAVFQLTANRGFAVLQQLYNVRLLVSLRQARARLAPVTPGAAWFPRTIVEIDRAEELATALSQHGADLSNTVRDTAWLLREDRGTTALPLRCAGARVDRVATDAVGQSAAFAVHVPAPCLLVVSTSYVSTLRARATTASGEVAAQVLPIDIALVGIVVPAGATSVELYPEVRIPPWSLVAALVGALLLLAAIATLPREVT